MAEFYASTQWPEIVGQGYLKGWSMFPYLWRFALHALLGGRCALLVEKDGSVHLVIGVSIDG